MPLGREAKESQRRSCSMVSLAVGAMSIAIDKEVSEGAIPARCQHGGEASSPLHDDDAAVSHKRAQTKQRHKDAAMILQREAEALAADLDHALGAKDDD
eukprot:6531131-Prymnesium_polylepis.1